jgi:hypothetical protein
MSYEWDAYDEADREQVAALMTELDRAFDGYSRMVIVLACTRAIAAMFGPAKPETREDYLKRFPAYVRSMWKRLDEIVQ